MAPRGGWTAERGEQEAQVLFLKKIDADPPSEFSSSEKGSPSVSLFKALRMGGLHAYRHFQPRLNAHPDTRMLDACKQPHWRAYPGARAHPFDARISGYARVSSGACKIVRVHQARLLPCWAHVSQATEAHIRYLQQWSIICNHLQIMNI